MSDRPPVRDENLRMILSSDEDQWIRGRIGQFRKSIRVMVLLMAVGAAWVAVDATGVFAPAPEPGCVTVQPAPGDARSPAEIARAMGAPLCAQAAPIGPWEEGPTWRDARGWANGLAGVLFLYGLIGLIRHLFLWRRYAGYLKDHRAFLEKYNRA